jgi:hypothetical protein
MRTKTPIVENANGSRILTVQRCCNGCYREIGDVTEDEINASICVWPLPDVRDECAWCAPFLADGDNS